jgi:EAL domain-containing protein (putative c-di-GMP-specific phosphodiesterase class I)
VPRSRSPISDLRQWQVFTLVGFTATAGYALDFSTMTNGICLLVIGIGAVLACFSGPRRRNAEPRAAWLLVGAAALSFLIGVLIRPVVTGRSPPLSLLADAATVPGYLLLGGFFIILLRARRSLERHAVLDGLIVCLAGGLASTVLLAAPAAAVSDRAALESLLAGLRPLFDVVLLLLVVNLTFTTTSWPLSLVTLLGSSTAMLIGDSAYAIIGISGHTYTSPLLDVPFLIGYTLLGTTALHPSVVDLSRAERQPVPAWSALRMALLVPALATPFVLLLVDGSQARHRRIIAAAGLLSMGLLLSRAVCAVRAQAVARSNAEHQATHAHDQVRERIELEAALRRALAEDQLQVAYQPIVQLTTGQPLGAEALCRWLHPERGPIPPATFIPIAEDAGLTGPIGTWVRRAALRQLGRWRADGTVGDDFYLSINVSPRQLSEPELPLTVSAELLDYHVPARCVALELTEPVLTDGSGDTGRVLFELRELGARLLIDDFGTGFSSLSCLRRFPVTGVKIDRSFVTGLGVSPQDAEIVRAVVAISQALGLTVIAEGVETRLQRDTLAALGVTNGQGWLWGPAVPPGEFAAHWHASGVVAMLGEAVAAGQNRGD